MRNPVTTRKLKFDGRLSAEWRGDLVDGSDDWLVVYYERPDHRTGAGAPAAQALHFFATSQPLTVLVVFDALGEVLEYQCDACMPARIDSRVIDWVDLDLDVMATADLRPKIRDFDDFARNAEEMEYTAEVIEAAGRGVNVALELIRTRSYPFDGRADQMLGRVLAGQGPL